MKRARVLVIVLIATGARASDDPPSSPVEALQLQPEVDAYVRLDERFRLIFQVQPTWIPEDHYSELTVSAYVDFFAFPIIRQLLTPDLARQRALNLRLGVQYTGTLDAGDLESSRRLALQFDITPRFFFPAEVLTTLRNRLETRWALGTADPFTFRYRARIQLEREFDLGLVPLTPFANTEFIWSTAQWSQIRYQAGLQCGLTWFPRGQILELNFTAVTYLHSTKLWVPQLGLVWAMYF